MAATVDALCAEYWQAYCEIHPLTASYLGFREYDELVPDLSAPGQAAQAGRFRALAQRAAAADDGTLAADDRVTVRMLASEAAARADEQDEAAVEYTVAPAITGPLVDVFETCPRLSITDAYQAEALVVRHRRLAGAFDMATRRLREGLARGRTPVAHTVQGTVDWLDSYLASALADDPLLAPAAPAAWSRQRTDVWREALQDAVATSVRPALARMRDVLASDVLPAARSPERAGLCWLPGGEELYAAAVRRHTGAAHAPDALHALGRAAVEALTEEYQTIGGQALATSDLTDIFGRLREDPALRFTSVQEVRTAAEVALARAQEAVPRWFGRQPRTGCVVRPMDPHEVEHGTIAYYQPPASDGSRPGVYYVNTHAPHTRTRFEAEALAFHEAVPGHHTQVALAQELDLPTFRRHAVPTAYSEGWALYTERLADEMGLYSDALARLGMLAFDSWRAGRLVVDTGLHARGWSREQAVAYLREHSPLAANNIANEVDRYIVLPGQALAYKVGQRRILDLRQRAQRSLRSRFDLAAFHDAVLASGPLPLDVLDEQLDAWIASQQ